MNESDHIPDWVSDVIRVRAVVGALGEAASGETTNDDQATRAWWKSRSTSAAGRAALAQLFPRTAISAALSVVSRAARVVHDERIGQPGVMHLFRLPASDETVIDR